MRARAAFWLRWSWRDLRDRWLQVVAIALIIGVGSGFYSGLSATSIWRRTSYAASYQATGLYDLRIQLATGSYAEVATVQQALAAMPQPDRIAGSATRLTGAIQVDASTGRRTILVPATLVGTPVRPTGRPVGVVGATDGRTLRPGDEGRMVAVLDAHLARFYGLAATGHVTLSGGHRLRYVGQGVAPEYLVVLGPQQQQEPDNGYTIVYTSLGTAGTLLGHPGQTNDIALALAPHTPVAATEAAVRRALTHALPGIGFTITTKAHDPGRTLLLAGLHGGQRLYTIFAGLLLAGAAFGAFNLVVRIIESQRREIGVAMALGAPPSTIARRPLLLGAEVALLGIAMGLGVGLLVDQLIGRVLRRALPLPVWHTAFQLRPFVVGAGLGFAIPLLAIAYPVWRAVRVSPSEAIRTTPTAARSTRVSGWFRAIHLPGNSIVRMPLRNIVRSRRRTLATLAAIAATTTVLVALVGMVDSFHTTIEDARADISDAGVRRSIVTLSSFQLSGSPAVQAIAAAPGVEQASADVQVAGRLRHRDRSFDAVITLLDFAHGVWRPPIVSGRPVGARAGVVITTAAASDLHIGVGDVVSLRHPRRTTGTGYEMVTSRLPVLGITPLPTRQMVFLDARYAGLLHLQGVTDVVNVRSSAHVSPAKLQRTLFSLPGVASVQTPDDTVRAMDKELDEVLSVLRIVDAALVGLAALIAFNAASINFDERRREQATMFAFGLRPPVVMVLSVVESTVVGVVGALVGIGAGRILLSWMITSVMHDVVPDITITQALHGLSIGEVVALTAAAVTVAPLASYRRLSRMDVPSTLRVME